ncbi:hypothetical protein E2562_018718 [Oryza meyeriana var. granulata]|uniref:F-box domain-containing protein n=1 Tax=Oryza meyeriana var. granulata TaxID=110450 RepID=A0A6G1EMU4_9ORYZ|nr:hypothetical protein E2562_018718 [Oryza meyeriana var. granulata]
MAGEASKEGHRGWTSTVEKLMMTSSPMAEGDSNKWIPLAEKLIDDLILEILLRVPYKPLCRSKCVCRRWRRVSSHPDHRHLLPRYHIHNAITGFFTL